MKVFILVSAITLLALTSSSSKQEKETEIEMTKSLKILNIHETTDAKILLA